MAVALAGCGYSLRGNLPGHIRSVGVPVFTNRTSEPAVENILTQAVVQAFSTNGRLRVVKPEQADAILEGEVVDYQIQALAFDPRANIQQYRLVVTMNLPMRDVRSNTPLFQQPRVQEKSDFRVFGAVSQTISREETAPPAGRPRRPASGPPRRSARTRATRTPRRASCSSPTRACAPRATGAPITGSSRPCRREQSWTSRPARAASLQGGSGSAPRPKGSRSARRPRGSSSSGWGRTEQCCSARSARRRSQAAPTTEASE